MNTFNNMFSFYLKRRNKDFFVIIYNLILPVILVLLLGYLMRPSYSNGILTSFQYYYIVLVPFCTSLSITTSLYNAKEDRRENVSERIFSSPIDIKTLILSKILSSSVSLTIITTLLIIVGALTLGLNNPLNIFFIVILNVMFIFFCTVFGYFLGFSSENDDAIRSYLGLPTCILAFLGGCFFPIGSTNVIIDNIIKISPFYWLNRSIFSLIYDSNLIIFTVVFSVLLLLTGLLIVLSTRTFKKEAYI
ncbi:ABC transporter permease [Listeria monocytogenes]|nr:ABC transporter permease [Listeria monocytogenes]